MNIAGKIIRRVKWLYKGMFWMTQRRRITSHSPLKLTIGITTYLDRYDNCFKGLISKLAVVFPNEQIVVVVNGHFRHEEHVRYLGKIQEFCKQFAHVKLITHHEAVGLSKMWNEIVNSAVNDKILILNDDLDILPEFRQDIVSALKDSGKLITLNKSWSHFIIAKEMFSSVGSFDEGLLELGGEDDDYAARCAIAGIRLSTISIATVRPNLKEKERKNSVNSYGKIMSAELNGYSTYNTNYLNEKWEVSNTYFEGSTHVPDRSHHYWKSRKTL